EPIDVRDVRTVRTAGIGHAAGTAPAVAVVHARRPARTARAVAVVRARRAAAARVGVREHPVALGGAGVAAWAVRPAGTGTITCDGGSAAVAVRTVGTAAVGSIGTTGVRVT